MTYSRLQAWHKTRPACILNLFSPSYFNICILLVNGFFKMSGPYLSLGVLCGNFAIYINKVHMCLLVCSIMKTYHKTIYEYDLGQCDYEHFE